ncbi:cytochrome P450 [Sphingorhabdus sp.]|jgi:cytochrome P450|uniref:cytochrome P450 n=1 Tax=Sphingorhabdus sp. TaxID=1902408 RepID=UPI003BAF222D|nr:cytochrome P450 [Sphingomonadales bacterium]MBL0022093.1 cytochrome P450 [Sphingomonadales bacterium]
MALASSEAANPHWAKRAGKNDLSHIPGENGWPVIGTTLRMLRDPVGYGRHMVETYGPVFRSNAFGGQNISLVGADANELMLFDRDKLFSSEQGWGPLLNLLFPRGLMLMDFDHHRMDRRALGVAFKPEPMRGYVAEMNRIFAEQLPRWRGDMVFYPAIKQITLDVAASAFLGVPLGPEADRVNKAFVDMVQASIGVVRAPVPGTAMGRGVAGRKYLIDYFGPQIEERRRNENRQDMFSQFCRATRDDGSHLNDGEIIDHMNFLMMAAHDTITSSVTSMVAMLARYPEWQEKVRAECLSIAPAGANITPEQLDAFEITEMVFKETLRVIPPVPSIPRRALRDFEFRGYKIPAGTSVGISPSYVHKMPEYWEDPERFDPLRFTPENSKGRHKYAWVPFGGGAHMCLGLHFAYMQMKLFIHHLLTQVSVETAEGYVPEWQPWPIPKPADGLKVTMRAL